MRTVVHRVASIAWPSFLVASVLEIAVFAFVDPLSLHTLGGDSLQLSAMAVYSLAFFAFWLFTAAACGLTLLLADGVAEVPQRRGG
jgi:hypothetical protein